MNLFETVVKYVNNNWNFEEGIGGEYEERLFESVLMEYMFLNELYFIKACEPYGDLWRISEIGLCNDPENFYWEIDNEKCSVNDFINDISQHGNNEDVKEDIKYLEWLEGYEYLDMYLEEICNACQMLVRKKDIENIIAGALKGKGKEKIIKNKKKKRAYIIKDCNTGYYKIGNSINPKHRERTLQAENPNYKLIKQFKNNVEKKLHKEYKDYRLRGEWFNLNKIQVEYICTNYI